MESVDATIRLFCFQVVNEQREPARDYMSTWGSRTGLQIINVPCGLYPGLAPTCSSRRFQLAPRK